MAEDLWKIVNILGDRPHAQLRKWLRKFVKLSYKTEDRLSTMLESFAARFWDDWGKMWGVNGLRCGRTETGCCTMTMRLHTPRSLWGNSWQNVTWPLFPTLPTHLTWPPCDFYVYLKMKLRMKGRRFVSIEEIQAESQQTLNTLTPEDFNECFQKLGKIAGIVVYKPKVTTSKVTVEIRT